MSISDTQSVVFIQISSIFEIRLIANAADHPDEGRRLMLCPPPSITCASSSHAAPCLFILGAVIYLGASMETASVTNDTSSTEASDGKRIGLCAAAPNWPHFVSFVELLTAALRTGG